MKSPDVFDRLRAAVLELKTAWPATLVSASYTEYDAPTDRVPRCWIERGRNDDRVARLDELLTQAVLGADLAITPGPTAAAVWLPLLVAYAKRTGSSWKVKTGIEGTGTARDAAGAIVDESSSRDSQITDLFGLAADYLEHLKTQALAERSSAAPPAVAEATVRNRIALAINECRQDCAWTLDELAEEMDLDRPTVASHTAGAKTPRPRNLARYAAVFSKKLNRVITVSDLRRGKTNTTTGRPTGD